MPSKTRSAVAPLYLFACLLLGGSVQGVWQNALLQLVGLAIIGWAAAAPARPKLPAPAKTVIYLAIGAIALVALQMVPLGSAFTAPGIREHIAEGYQTLGRPMPSLPIALAPYDSFAALLAIIPPLAIYCAIVRLDAFRPSWLAAALIGGTIAGILVGALQVASSAAEPRYYPYAETNFGVAVGFFANANHMASLLVIALPFTAALVAGSRHQNVQRRSAMLAFMGMMVILLLAGIALNGSLAGFALAVPVLAASALIVLPAGNKLRWLAGGLAALSVAGAIAVLATSAIGGTKIGQDATGAFESRKAILDTTGKAIADSLPWGTGLGSFKSVYRLYESPDTVTNEYVIHAHNDYAEVALELGVPGMVLIALFLAWWARAVWTVWRRDEGSAYTRAASIASAAVLIHSLVDFPLRTAAIAVSVAMCIALLADRRRLARHEPSDLRPARHRVFE